MRVKDFLKMYRGINRVRVEIYASVIVFSEEHYVLLSGFDMDCANRYSNNCEYYFSEEIIGFEIVNGILRIMIRGCE